MARVVPIAVAVLAATTLTAAGSTGRQNGTNTLIVLDRSIGGVALKELRSKVEHTLGKGLVLSSTVDNTARPTPAYLTKVSYGYGSLIVFYVSGKGHPAQVLALETTSKRYRTRSGLGVGSSYAKLMAAGGVNCYGGAECQHGYHALNKPGTTFRLDQPGGKVVLIAMAFGH